MNFPDDGICRKVPFARSQTWWFPRKNNTMSPIARAFCDACAVREQCENYIMKMEGTTHASERYGNWAGMTPIERAQLRKARMRERR